MPRMKIRVGIPGSPVYEMRVGPGLLEELGGHLREVEDLEDCRHAVIVTDENVSEHYLSVARRSLANAGMRCDCLALCPGEETKSVEVAQDLWMAFADMGADRATAVVALGGGVVGDVAGFAASTYMRGLPLVLAPTTLLAMVDSAIGGKNAVNLPQGKNLVGTFCQPSYVCADTGVLATLDGRQWACGLGEVAKMAMIVSDDLYFWTCDNVQALVSRGDEEVSSAIAQCAAAKADIVAADPFDRTGERSVLNYGHTLGHALEASAGYGSLSHGECVATGMRFAAHVACACGVMPAEIAQAQNDLLDGLRLAPVALGRKDVDGLVDFMMRDKKAYGGEVKMVLLGDIGEACRVTLSRDDLVGCLGEFIEGGGL